MKAFFQKIISTFIWLYFIVFLIYAPYYNWDYAKTHGFVKWLLFGEVVATSKAMIWPYFVIFSIPNVENNFTSNNYQPSNECELIKAVKNGNISKIKEFIADKNFNINMKTDNGRSLLMLASRRGYVNIVKMFLDKGAQVNYRDPLGDTALIYASTLIFANKSEIINLNKITKLLIDRGANVNFKSVNGMTALMYASKFGYVTIVKNILSCEKVDLDCQDKLDGMTALMLASMSGNISIVKMLVKSGAKINLKNNYGKTALMLAHAQHYAKIENIIQHQSTND